MSIVSDVEIRLRADIARLQQDLNAARRSVSGAVGDIKKTLAGMVAGFSLLQVVQQAIAAQRQFDKLNSSLVTVTGSNKAAAEAFAVLQDFAAKTPFSVQEVTAAFLKLRNMGLTPSERALRSYGDTASGMGKDLNQLIEAVADAATGEFERLKEFGIKSKKQGDQVAFTFQGTTTKVGNSAKEIEDYLMAIGEVNFAGGMERQAGTLDGALSALGDTWDQTLVAFMQTGFGEAVHGSVLALSGALGDLIAMFKAVKGAAHEEGKAVEEIGPLHKGLTTFFETIMVLGTNVSYVFRAIGGDIGSFAAQVGALFRNGAAGMLDGSTMKEIRAISAARTADAQRERAEVDATTARILGAAAAAQETRKKEAAERAADTTDRLAKYKIQADGTKQITETEIKELEKRVKAYAAFSKTIDQRVAETAREAAGLAPLNEGQKLELELKEKLVDGTLVLSAAQEASALARIKEVQANLASVESQKAYQKMIEDSGKLEKEMVDTRADAVKAARAEVDANQELVATFGMSEAAIARLEVARLREQLAQRASVGMTLDEIEHLEQLIVLKEQSADAVANLDELKKTKDFWTDIEKTAHDTFMSIEDGGKGMWQRMKETAKNTFFNWLYQQTIKKWIINIQANTSGAGGLASLVSGEGGGGIGDWFSAGKSIYTGFTSGMASTFGTWAQSAGKMFGSSAVSSFGSGMSAGVAGSGDAAMAASAASSGNLSAGASAGLTAAKAIPIAGWIAAGMALSNSLYKKGWDAQNGSLTDSAMGKAIMPFNAPMLLLNKTLQKLGMNNTMANMFSGASTISRLFGRKNPEITEQGIQGTLSATGLTGEAYAKILEKGGVFRSDKNYTKTATLAAEQQQMFDSTMRGMVEAVKGFGGVLGAEARNIDGYSKAISLTLTDDAAKNEAAIAEIFAGVADELAVRMLPNIAAFSQQGETAAATLQRLTANFQAVDAVMAGMGFTSTQAFRATGVASIEARERLVALTGGIESLAGLSQFFADNFLTGAQKIAPVQRQVTEQLEALGYAGYFTATQFRVAVEDLARSGALATEEGAKTYAGMLALAPKFKAVTDYMIEMKRADADAAVQGLQRAVDAQRKSVEAAYASVMTALRTRLDGVSDSIERMTDLSQTLKGALIGVEAPGAASASRQVADAEIATALAIAKARGVLPSVDDLRDALGTLGRDSSDEFATMVDYQRAVARSNAQLNELGGLTEEQLGTAELQLRALEAQQAQAETAHVAELGRLDGILANAQLQLDAANDINFSVMAVGDAVTAAHAAIRALNIANGGSGGVAVPSPVPTIPVVAVPPQSGTMSAESGLLAELRRMNERLGNIEVSNNQMATDNAQLTRQFNDVTAGGNVLLTESA